MSRQGFTITGSATSTVHFQKSSTIPREASRYPIGRSPERRAIATKAKRQMAVKYVGKAMASKLCSVSAGTREGRARRIRRSPSLAKSRVANGDLIVATLWQQFGNGSLPNCGSIASCGEGIYAESRTNNSLASKPSRGSSRLRKRYRPIAPCRQLLLAWHNAAENGGVGYYRFVECGPEHR